MTAFTPNGDLVVVVPVKPLAMAKSRLAAHLTLEERSALVLRLLGHVLTTVHQTAVTDRCLVVSADPRVRTWAAQHDAEPLAEQPTSLGIEHNAALEQAREVAQRRGRAALLVISADLPLLRPGDVTDMVALGSETNSIVIAPDRAGTGTNALLLRPIDIVPFRFGPGSFARHVAEARALGTLVRVHESDGTAFDLDRPEDLITLEQWQTAIRANPL